MTLNRHDIGSLKSAFDFRPFVFCVILSSVVAASAVASSPGSRWDALMSWNAMALPFASYSPETDWQFGATGVWFFKTDTSMASYSDLTFDGAYSLRRQWYVNAASRIYLPMPRRAYIDAKVRFQYYPDRYWGRGNEAQHLLESPPQYTSQLADIYSSAQFEIDNAWYLGAALHWRRESISGADALPVSVEAGTTSVLSLGVIAMYDSRSTTYYPDHGVFGKLALDLCQPLLGFDSYTPFVKIDFDLRHFMPLGGGVVFASNLKMTSVLGDNVPFRMLPSLGGQDIIRGYRARMFSDNTLVALQGELRVPIWRFFKAAAFVSIGDVYDYRHWHVATPKVGYGVGLRANIHKANTNIRFDVARQNFDRSWVFYFTVKEAF